MTRGCIPGEPVERLARIGYLTDSAFPFDGSELRRFHATPRFRLLTALGQHQLGPDLRALGGTGHLARLQGIERLAACENLSELAVRDRRNGNASGGAVGHSTCHADSEHGCEEPANDDSSSRGASKWNSMTRLLVVLRLVHVVCLLGHSEIGRCRDYGRA